MTPLDATNIWDAVIEFIKIGIPIIFGTLVGGYFMRRHEVNLDYKRHRRELLLSITAKVAAATTLMSELACRFEVERNAGLQNVRSKEIYNLYEQLPKTTTALMGIEAELLLMGTKNSINAYREFLAVFMRLQKTANTVVTNNSFRETEVSLLDLQTDLMLKHEGFSKALSRYYQMR